MLETLQWFTLRTNMDLHGFGALQINTISITFTERWTKRGWQTSRSGTTEVCSSPHDQSSSIHSALRRTRHSHPATYHLPYCRMLYWEKSFFLKTISDWNNLFVEVALSPTLECFNPYIYISKFKQLVKENMHCRLEIFLP